MSDLGQWDVHGRVETLRTEWGEWDKAKNDWQPSKRRTSGRFRPDGQVIGTEAFNPDGSIARTARLYNEAGRILETGFQMDDGPVSKVLYFYDGDGRIVRIVNIDQKGVSGESEIYRYDSSGRKTKIQFLPKVEGTVAYSLDIEGAASLFGTSGAATVTTAFDDHDQASEVTVHDTLHRLQRRMILTRDSAGRTVKQEVLGGDTLLLPGLENSLKDAPPEAREKFRAALATAFGPKNVLLTITYAYDEKGRKVERTNRMGTLSEDRTTFHFDDHDNPIEENSEHTSRDVGVDEQGNPRHSNEHSDKQHTRFVNKYDAEGNWTEREVWTNFEPGGDLKRSSLERRQITYYPPELH
jgi:hypothetical protein